MTTLQPDRPSAVPTVVKLPRAKRCTGTVQTARHRRCPIYTDTALDGRALCHQHLVQALRPGQGARAGDVTHDRHLVPETWGPDYVRRGELLRQALLVLRLGIPDPTTCDRFVLAVVPAALIEQIESALEGEP